MPDALKLVVTAAGRAALINAQNDGTNAVRIAQAGVSPNYIAATPATVAMPGEVKRITTISGAVVENDTIHLIVRDESTDSYTTRSLALYLADGTLFAIYSQAGVLVEKSSQAMLLLQCDTRFEDIAAAQITFGDANFLNPPATTQTAGVAQIATDAEALAFANVLKILTPRQLSLAMSAATILSRLMTVDGAGSGLDADLLDGRQANEFALLAGANFSGSVSATGFSTAGGATASGGLFVDASAVFRKPTATLVDLQFDEGDVFRYDRGSNRYDWFVGGIGIAYLSSTTFGVSNLTIGGYGAWHQGNDGSGSGLDADLLDGRQGNEFALLTGASFSGGIFAPVVAATTSVQIYDRNFAGSGDHGYQIYSSGDVLSLYSNNTTLNGATLSKSGAFNAAGPITRAGFTVWDAANDGAGSGMDADMLDGRQAAEFALLTGAGFTGNVGIGIAPGTPYGRSLQLSQGAGTAHPMILHQAINTNDERLWMLNNLQPPNGGYTGLLYYNKSGCAGSAYLTYGGSHIFYSAVPGVAGNAATLIQTMAVDPSGNLYAPGDLFAGAIYRAWHPGNDGSGSGLDADMLDGRHAAEFPLLTGANFSGNVSAAGFSTVGGVTANGGMFIDAAAVFKKPTASLIDLQFDEGDVFRYDRGANRWDWIIGSAGVAWLTTSTFGAPNINAGANITAGGTVAGAAVTVGGFNVWHPANDGSGSGLDADLLDGLHASAFALLTDATRAGSNANGYWEKRPNGVIEQWGTLAGPFNEGQIPITFPVPFTDENSIVITPVAINSVASDKYDISMQRVSKTVNGCVVYAQYSAAASSINQINGVDWRAVGR